VGATICPYIVLDKTTNGVYNIPIRYTGGFIPIT